LRIRTGGIRLGVMVPGGMIMAVMRMRRIVLPVMTCGRI
jgi:hypothetical protein